MARARHAPAAALLALLLASAAPWGARAQVPEHCKNATQSYDISFVGPLKHIQVGPVRYGYHRFGPLTPGLKAAATLPPLIMLSGLGAYMYIHPIPIMQRSAADREVIIFDHMRVGASANDSSAAREPLTVQLMARSTADFIKALRLPRKPDLYGWSLGGAVVTAMAALHGGSFRHGVIINGWAGGDRSYVMPDRGLEQLLSVRNNVTAYLSFLFPDGANDDGVCQLFAAWNSFYDSAYVKLVQPLTDEVLAEQVAAKDRSLRDNTVADALPSVRNRLLVFGGMQDKIVPVRNAAVIADPVPGSWQLRFADQGHGLPFEDPKSVIYLMSEFWGFAVNLSSADVAGMSYGVLAADAAPLQLNATARRGGGAAGGAAGAGAAGRPAAVAAPVGSAAFKQAASFVRAPPAKGAAAAAAKGAAAAPTRPAAAAAAAAAPRITAAPATKPAAAAAAAKPAASSMMAVRPVLPRLPAAAVAGAGVMP